MLELIIKELSESEEGLSYWEVYKHLGKKYNMRLHKTGARYHLEQLRKRGLLDKNGTKYKLKGAVVAYNGVLLFSNPPALVNCPWYSLCKTKDCLGDGCQFYKKSGSEFRKYLDALLNPKRQ